MKSLMLGALALALLGCAAPSPARTIVITPSMPEAAFVEAAGDRLHSAQDVRMGALIKPYRLVFDCCVPQLVLVDRPAHPVDTIVSSPLGTMSFVVSHQQMTAEAAVEEAQRVYDALRAANYSDRNAAFSLTVEEAGTLADADDRLSVFNLVSADGRQFAEAELTIGAAPLLAPGSVYYLSLSIGDNIHTDP